MCAGRVLQEAERDAGNKRERERASEPAVTDEAFWHRRAAETKTMRVGASTVLQSLFRVYQADLDSLNF